MDSTVPELLERLRMGDQSAMNELTAVLYGELRQIAARHLRSERANHTLQTTALVHEAYLRLCEHPTPQFVDRPHFLAISSRIMRQVLVDYARARSAKKRGGKELDNLQGEPGAINLIGENDTGIESVDLLDLDNSLQALANEDTALARLIEMRYFGGMTAEDIAEALGQSVHIIRHELRFAQAWLRQKMGR